MLITHHYPIDDFDVIFPFLAENHQKLYMQALIQQLNNGSKNHIYINSQTGTGKTLSLLCGLLATTTKKVIFCSRTHE